MSAQEKTTKVDLSAVGGRKIDHHVPEKLGMPIDLSHLGGKRVGEPLAPGDSIDNEANPD
jgi:hypothetical protein